MARMNLMQWDNICAIWYLKTLVGKTILLSQALYNLFFGHTYISFCTILETCGTKMVPITPTTNCHIVPSNNNYGMYVHTLPCCKLSYQSLDTSLNNLVYYYHTEMNL
jgi:hypothetical protein